jgi:hypothetical protein
VAQEKILYAEALTVMSEVLGQVLGPEGDVWGWYPQAPRTDHAGVAKYTTFALVEAPIGASEGTSTSWMSGQADVPESRMRIIQAKLDELKFHVSSISGRNMESDPPVYGGASSFRVDHNAWGLAGSGAQELVDHLIVLQLLVCTSKIMEEDYEARSDLDYPGVREAMAQVGMNAGTYMAMKAGIEARFRHAVNNLHG